MTVDALLDAIPLPAWIHDVETREVVSVNEAFVKLCGHPRELLIGSPMLDLCAPTDRQRVAAILDKLLTMPEGKLDHPEPFRLLVEGGGTVRARISSNPLPSVRRHARLAIAHDIQSDESERTTEMIAQSEQRYRTLFEACPIAACVYDLSTLQFIAVNEAMVQLYDYSREELLSMTVLDLVSPEDVGFLRSLIDDLRRGLRPGVLRHTNTIRHRKRGGEDLDIQGIAASLTDSGRRARLILHNDVTQQKRAELELVKRARIDAFRADLGDAMTSDEPLFAHLERVASAMEHYLELQSVGIWVVDEATSKLELRASASTFDTIVAGGRTVDFGETWIGRTAAGAAPVLFDTTSTALSPIEIGQIRTFGVSHVAAFPVVIRRRALGVITVTRDAPFPEDLVTLLGATATQIAQALATAFAYEALRKSESLSRSILDNMLSALITLDEDGMIETINPAAEKTFGYAGAELVGRPFSSLFDMASLDPKRLLSTARGRVTEWRGQHKSGQRFPCELRLFHLENLRGTGYAAILHDVSERYEVERMKTEFVSVVSHELRTPLTALRGSIGLLAGGVMGALPEGVMELLHIAERNTLRLISLVNDILDLERLQKGKMELFLHAVRARSIIERSLESVSQFADQEQIRIEVHHTSESVKGDGDRLVQVLINLLSNAVKFSTPGSVVTVIAKPEPETICFSVKDEGRGIPPPFRRVIFERFHQVHTSDSREKGGTGLGLAISKAIVEQHGGTIGVESEEGKGSTFWFRVPRVV